MDAEHWDTRYASADLVWSAEPNQFVAAECADLPPGRALDLACGEGRNAIWLARRGWRVTAVDFSAVALDKARTLAGETAVDWVQADATTWASPPAFDLAVLAYLQLPAAERKAAVSSALAALVPGGTLLVVAHDSSNLAEGTGGPQDPDVLMTSDDILADVACVPHRVVHAGRVERHLAQVDGSTAVAYDCLVRVVKEPTA